MSVPFYAARSHQDLVKELVASTPKLAAILATASHARRMLTLVTPQKNGLPPEELTSSFQLPSAVEVWLAKKPPQTSSKVQDIPTTPIEPVSLTNVIKPVEGRSKRIDLALSKVYQKYGLHVQRSANLSSNEKQFAAKKDVNDEVFFDEKISEREFIRLAAMIVRIAFPQYQEDLDRGKFFAQVLNQLKSSARTVSSSRPMNAIPSVSRRALITSVIYGTTNHYYGVLKNQKPSLFDRSKELTRRMAGAVTGIAGTGEAMNFFKSEDGSFYPSRLEEVEKHKAIVALDHMSSTQLKQQLLTASAHKAKFIDAVYTNNKDSRGATEQNHWQEFHTTKFSRLVQQTSPVEAPQQREQPASSFERPTAY